MISSTLPLRFVLGVGITISVVALIGCSKVEPPLPVTVKNQSQENAVVDKQVKLVESKPSEQKNAGRKQTKTPDFQPPFPQRSNLFIAPKLNHQVVRSTTDNHQDEIQLKGFADVQGIRAVLAFGGKVKLLKEGETYQEVSVLKIAPPRITLQRGRIRWTIQLYESPK